MWEFFYQNLKEMKHTINSNVFHSTDNVIVHVTMKQPDPHTLHGCKDSREEIALDFAVIADMFLFVNKWIKKMLKCLCEEEEFPL